MKPRSSITLRLIVHLIPAQILALAIGWAVVESLDLAGIRASTQRIDDFAVYRTQTLLIASLFRGDDGELRIEPTAALREEMKRVPTLKLAAYDISHKMIARGSASELTPLFVDPPGINLLTTNYFLADDRERYAVGLVDSKSTALGEVRIAIYGDRLRWDDPFLLLEDQFNYYWPYILIAFLLCSTGTWLAVRRGLAPLLDVAADAAKIDVDQLNQRLSERGMPAEILPLVGAVNEALSRLDVGVGRLRRFAANAAHELSTPVAILEARLDHFDVATIKTDLRRDVRRLRVIVEQLLASARLARSARPRMMVDLVGVCQAVVDDYAMLAVRQRKAIKCEAHADGLETPDDAGGVQSVIANLVNNALRAEPVGGAVIVRVGPNGLVEVVDHGPGIAKEEREIIFEPFWRKSEATPGSGLGLAIAKELTEALGGHIWVEETPGGGATFKLSFPTTASIPAGAAKDEPFGSNTEPS